MGIKGRAVAFGTMNIDNYELTGVFVECSVDELKDQSKLHFNENVEIVLEKSLTPNKDLAKCDGCKNDRNGHCLLSTNHCIRQAEDYFAKS